MEGGMWPNDQRWCVDSEFQILLQPRQPVPCCSPAVYCTLHR